jgi:hypothetical protein
VVVVVGRSRYNGINIPRKKAEKENI